jgi:hypothetical protein
MTLESSTPSAKKAREYRKKYPDRTKAATKRWRGKNPNYFKIYKRTWRKQEHVKEKDRAYKRMAYARDPERYKALSRTWRAKNPDKTKRSTELLQDGYLRGMFKRRGYPQPDDFMIDALRTVYQLNRLRRYVCHKNPNLRVYWKRGQLRHLGKPLCLS